MFEFTVQKLNALYSYIFPCKGEHMVEEGLTDGGDGSDDLAELELVEDGGLTGGIKPDHEDPHLLLGEEAAEQLPEREPHLFLETVANAFLLRRRASSLPRSIPFAAAPPGFGDLRARIGGGGSSGIARARDLPEVVATWGSPSRSSSAASSPRRR